MRPTTANTPSTSMLSSTDDPRGTAPAARTGPPAGPPPPVPARRIPPRADGPPPPPSTPPPVPPPARPGPARPPASRAPLAAWVAGLGALLLLAAAATFLAVSWEALGATARIAIVAGLTASAVVGGDRLRRTLPVVGSVVFHLGALLLPVDALGLVLQLGGPVWLRWVAAGATAIVALPLLAVAGRAPVLAGLSLAGVPVLATGLALAGGPGPAIVVALAGLVLLPLAGRTVPSALAPVATLGSVVLPVAAVALGLAAELLAALSASGVSAAAAEAGWVAGWQVRAVVAVLVVTTLAVRARRGETWLVAVAIATAVLALLHLVLPEATPRAVRLWTPAFVWLALEAAASAVRRREPAGTGLRAATLVAELVAAPVVLFTVSVVLAPTVRGWQPDTVLAGVLAIAAGAWLLAALRLERDRRTDDLDVPAGMLQVLLVVAAWHVVAVPVLLGAGTEVVVVTAGVLALLPALLRSLRRRADLPFGLLVGDLLAASALLLAAAVPADGERIAVLVAVLAPVALLPLLHTVAARVGRTPQLVTGGFAALLVVAVGELSSVGFRAAGLPVGLTALVVGATAIAVAQVVAPVRLIAGAARLLAVVAAVTSTLPIGLGRAEGWVGAADDLPLVVALQLDTGALIPVLVLGILLALDAVADRGPLASAGVALVTLRAVTAVALAAGVELAVVGAALLAVGITAATLAALAGRGLADPATSAGSAVGIGAIPVGWVLLGGEALLRASALLGAGVLLLLAGLAARRLTLAHTGAAVATLGSWSLLVELDVTALDLWLLPVAVQVLLAGVSAQRSGPTSSWVAEAPAVALVGVPAVLERLTGGPGWHGLLAGAVGVVAVVAGGRLARRGPLVVGVVVTVAIVAVETLAVVASLPTWAWLTLGGVVLLLAAASIERLGQTPKEAARRVAAGLRDPEPVVHNERIGPPDVPAGT